MAEWSDHDLTIDGLTIHCYGMGERGKPPIVLLHGFSDFGLGWLRLAMDLASDYRLIMPDAVSHGRSSAPGPDGFRGRAVSDVLALIDRLGLDRPFLIGHSMGALTAAGVAAAAADRLRGIVLEDPGWRDESAGLPPPASAARSSLAPVGSPQWLEWIVALHKMSTVERIAAARAERPNWSEEDRRYWAEGKARFNLACLDDVAPAKTPLFFSATQWCDVARRITCPVLLIIGDPARGAIVTMTLAEEAVRLWRSGRVANIPQAGHNIRRDQYEPYRAAVTRFLEAHR